MNKIICLGFMSLLAACTSMSPPNLKTQLQVREFQTRTFDTAQTDQVLSAVVDAFQDQGFMVKNVVPQVGLVSASREVDVEDTGQMLLQTFVFGHNAVWGKNAMIEANANVKTQGNKTKVRAVFQEKVLNNRGDMDTVHTIEDPKFYQDFFEKISKSIFIEKQRI